ncbi:MAG: hypothetical protein EBU09_09600 [Betaproteobacteria bacterium]|nr:hypothetical protein [Betaproteobacteria bacterium]
MSGKAQNLPHASRRHKLANKLSCSASITKADMALAAALASRFDAAAISLAFCLATQGRIEPARADQGERGALVK